MMSDVLSGVVMGMLIVAWVYFIAIQPGYWSRDSITKRSDWKKNRSAAKELLGMISFGIGLLLLTLILWPFL